MATPAVLPLPGPHGHYKRGYGLVLFLNSRGEVTAYYPYGERAWQVRYGATVVHHTFWCTSCPKADVRCVQCADTPVHEGEER